MVNYFGSIDYLFSWVIEEQKRGTGKEFWPERMDNHGRRSFPVQAGRSWIGRDHPFNEPFIVPRVLDTIFY